MRVLFISRRFVRGLAAATMLLAVWMVSLQLWQGQSVSVSGSAASKSIPIYSVGTDEKKVAITFDAAWGSDSTAAILDLLDQYHAKSTFFLVGYWVDSNPDMVIEIVARGHEIGNHSNTHAHMSKLSQQDILAELANDNQKINALVDQEIFLFRPPYGEWDENLVSVAREAGFEVIQWDVDSLDWKGLSADEILQRVKQRIQNGSIVLFHNNSDHILDGLEAVLKKLSSDGYEFVRVSDLVYPAPYDVDVNGRQHVLTAATPVH